MSRPRSGLLAAPIAALVLLAGCADGEVDPVAVETGTPTGGPTGLPSASPTAVPGAADLEIRPVLTSTIVPGADVPPELQEQFDTTACPGVGAGADEPLVACEDDGVKYLLGPAEIVGGVESAAAMIPQDAATWVVLLELDDAATDVFADLTGRLAGTEQQIAVVVDGVVVTAPTVQSPIADGQVQISGDFDEQSAGELAERLQG